MLSRFAFLFFLFILTPNYWVKAQSFTLSGYVKDSATGETLIGASIRNLEGTLGTVTNSYGFFSLSVPNENTQLICSYIGYQSKKFSAKKGKGVQIELAPQTKIAKEVVISGDRVDKNVRSTEMSRIEISGEKLKSLPVVFGEPDVLKAITLLPGIKSGGEASTGFYVRGGGPDQNLILMDEAVVYNPSHLFGFLSVFNSYQVY